MGEDPEMGQRIIRPTQIRSNGNPPVLEISWGPVAKLFATLSIILLAAGVTSTIQMYREIGELRAERAEASKATDKAVAASMSAIRSVSDDLKKHLDWSVDVLQKLATKEELYRHASQRGHVPVAIPDDAFQKER